MIRGLVFVLVKSAFALLWAAPNVYVEKFIQELHPGGFESFALRFLQILFAISTAAPVCVWLYRDIRLATQHSRNIQPALTSATSLIGAETHPSHSAMIGRDYSSRRALAVRRQQRRDTAAPFELTWEDALFFHLSRLFGFLLVLGAVTLFLGVAAAPFLLLQPPAMRWDHVYQLLAMAGGTVLVALLAGAALSHLLSSYYSPDRARIPFECLLTLSFLSSFRFPHPGASAETDSRGNGDGWRGAA